MHHLSSITKTARTEFWKFPRRHMFILEVAHLIVYNVLPKHFLTFAPLRSRWKSPAYYRSIDFAASYYRLNVSLFVVYHSVLWVCKPWPLHLLLCLSFYSLLYRFCFRIHYWVALNGEEGSNYSCTLRHRSNLHCNHFSRALLLFLVPISLLVHKSPKIPLLSLTKRQQVLVVQHETHISIPYAAYATTCNQTIKSNE